MSDVCKICTQNENLDRIGNNALETSGYILVLHKLIYDGISHIPTHIHISQYIIHEYRFVVMELFVEYAKCILCTIYNHVFTLYIYTEITDHPMY